MSKNNVVFSCTSLVGTNKVGNLKRTEEGYYPVVVGALNMFNSAGHFYTFDKVRDLFTESSTLMRRVKRGVLRGEYGHPRQNGMDMMSFAKRIMDIEEKNVACHHMHIELDFDSMKDESGRPVVAIVSHVAPNGPYGHVLERQLQNPKENVCFSIRSFTKDRDVMGVLHREIKQIVTFDYVNEPGMSIAEKFKSPALECFSDTVINRAELEAVVANSAGAGVAQESSGLNALELFSALGWNKNNDLDSMVKNSPLWKGW